MTARFIPSDYDGGRIVLRSGTIDVGAVFPPWGERQHRYPWSWRLWLTGRTTVVEGRAKTEDAAKAALRSALTDFLAKVNLSEVPS